jgi:murein L,D-transpeptidase YafK
LSFSQIASVLVKMSIFAVVAADLAGCAGAVYAPKTAVKTGSVRPSTLRQMDSLNMDRVAPVLIRIYKEESTLEVWKQDRTGKFALLSSYPICKFSGNLGPKLVQGGSPSARRVL